MPLTGRLTVSNLTIDLDKETVTRDTALLSLKKNEFNLLKILISQKNKVVSKSDLIGIVADKEIRENTLHAYMVSLRKKIDGSFTPRLIYTATGKGYILLDEAAAEEQGQLL